MQVSWTVLKNFSESRNISVQYIDLGDAYDLVAFDGMFKLEAVLNKNTDECTDFETNFKPSGNKTIQKRNSNGEVLVAPTMEDLGDLTTIWKGSLYTASANSLSFFDEEIVTQQKLREGWYKILQGGTVGDYLECSIIDKNDVLGLFSQYNLTVGQDILELKKYVRTEYISPTSTGRQEFRSNAASELMPGLFLRVAYLNTGSEAVIFAVTKKYHEA